MSENNSEENLFHVCVDVCLCVQRAVPFRWDSQELSPQKHFQKKIIKTLLGSTQLFLFVVGTMDLLKTDFISCPSHSRYGDMSKLFRGKRELPSPIPVGLAKPRNSPL